MLVSSDFLSSDYCYDVEMRRALDRHATGDGRVIPVILRAVEWKGAPFGHLQALPTDGQPVTSWSNRDEAFADVVRGIRQVVEELTHAGRPQVREGVSEARPTPRYFPQQARWLEERSHGVVGRGYVEEALDRFVAGHPRGYFIIEGGPGQGKTAVAAQISSSRRLAHHFISRTGRRNDARLILASFIDQLEAGRTREDLASMSLDDLTNRFDEALVRAQATRTPLLLVVDGLNEMSAGEFDDLPFLPADNLPTGVFFLVTSQPGDQLTRLAERLSTIPTRIYSLPALEPDEVRKLILTRRPKVSGAMVDELSRASRGNPLYVKAALDALEQSGHLDTAQLPAAVEGYFRRATRDLPANPLLTRVLGLLAVSRKGLTLRELSELTGASQRAVGSGSAARGPAVPHGGRWRVRVLPRVFSRLRHRRTVLWR